MLNCRKLDLSPRLAAKRTRAAEKVFGHLVLRRIVAFTLFILGVDRTTISQLLDMPPGTVRSQVRRILEVGIDAFLDHRSKTDSQVITAMPTPSPALSIQLGPENDPLVVNSGQLWLPQSNPVQRRLVLLSLMGEGMLTAKEVAQVLGLSQSHVHRLHRDLMSLDVAAVMDKRRGQLEDYRIDPELKGKMVAQYVLQLADEGRVSSAAVARRMEARYQAHISERTIRHHLVRMGLNIAKESLSIGLADLKKKRSSCGP